MIARFLCIAVLVAVASAQQAVPRTFIRPNPQTTNCPSPQTQESVNIYKSGAQTVCKYDYEEVCKGPFGPIVCNKHDAGCLESKIKYPSSFPYTQNLNSRPEECVSAGNKWHPETAVLGAAEPPVSFVLLLAASVATLVAVWRRVSIFAIITFFGIFIMSCFLIVSYYYLYAFIVIMVSLIALTCYATRDNTLVAAGMFAVFLGLLWLTYESGLGYMNHQSRLQPGADNTRNPISETQCLNYYRYYFYSDPSTREETHNPWDISYGLCNRGWLASVRAFAIFTKILLALLIASGAWHLSKPVVAEGGHIQDPNHPYS